ncbi:BTB/POZ domain-containing protein At3g56230 isoform X2 [Amborella trichopoda]|uniref:BTB/POZ domain-containing protein At3g56230 isoform X2 n=1 Tax=Amborella trichopoda TaxID=13333 RepID=UPI0005D315EF|nr:BTB/POZ domain-containing protein At3g56230 isoform X2 [Amborella trichopoda]|eukprot:XP_011624118.1 BTB/POZ domain-containing protein At3g56230 isoform X2 [Amborella trichopoda]
MPCFVCGSSDNTYLSPHYGFNPVMSNTSTGGLCSSCKDGANKLMDFLQELDKNPEKPPLVTLPPKGLSSALCWLKVLKEKWDHSNERLGFLEDISFAFENRIHTDISLKPDDGPAIFAHKAVLASRSPIFKTMLEADGCKAPPTEVISLPDKYDIPFLRKKCELQILGTLEPSNVFEVLKLSQKCSSETLKNKALETIVMYHEEILSSKEYVEFGHSNAGLVLEISWALSKKLSHTTVG